MNPLRLQAQQNSKDDDFGDPQGVWSNSIFAAICVVVGFSTLALSIFLVFTGSCASAEIRLASGGHEADRGTRPSARRIETHSPRAGSAEIREVAGEAARYASGRLSSLGSSKDDGEEAPAETGENVSDAKTMMDA